MWKLKSECFHRCVRGNIPEKTLRRMDAAAELPWMGSQRVFGGMFPRAQMQ